MLKIFLKYFVVVFFSWIFRLFRKCLSQHSIDLHSTLAKPPSEPLTYNIQAPSPFNPACSPTTDGTPTSMNGSAPTARSVSQTMHKISSEKWSMLRCQRLELSLKNLVRLTLVHLEAEFYFILSLFIFKYSPICYTWECQSCQWMLHTNKW